ncbi:hypothetical protein C0J52_00762 [Blattella germanica]|nr:hypothetical protein C0J52_00762 [Blattella germanica]
MDLKTGRVMILSACIIIITVLQMEFVLCPKPSPVPLSQFLQPDLVSDRDFFNETSCYRPCEEGAPPKICYYKWLLDDYKTMGPACRKCPEVEADCFRPQCATADGYERGMVTVNHQVSGPSIQVCLGDKVVVDVTNHFLGQSTTIHWHGVHQEGTPFMDGVPMVTQCPIPEMTTFRYEFEANNEGTLYWHSHDGFQKQDGIQGAMVVRLPKHLDPHGDLYDHDLASHVIFISDWMHRAAGEHFPGLQTHDMFQEPDSILLNGRGRFNNDGRSTNTPYSVFRVTKGKKYRFRVVGGMCTSCSYHLSIQDHPVLIIAVDGCPIEPVLVDSVVFYAGERYDFVVDANQDIKSYWIHVRASSICEVHKIYTLGILRYNGDTGTTLTDPGFKGHHDGMTFNVYNATCGSAMNGVCVSQMVSLRHVPPQIMAPLPDFSFALRFGFHHYFLERMFEPGEYNRYFEPIPNKLLSSMINNISFSVPPSPVITQREDIPNDNFCPKGHQGVPTCPGGESHCKCIQLIKVPLGAVVQFVLLDKEDEQRLLKRLESGGITIPPSTPVHKDTLAVPSNGYAVIRILANNPGYWFFHCHILYHADTGMALILQVGDHKEIPKPAVAFHKCGNFLPAVFKEDKSARKPPPLSAGFYRNNSSLSRRP